MGIRRAAAGVGAGLYKVLTFGAVTTYPFSRFKMYTAIRRAADPIAFDGPVLSISHSTHLLPILGADGLRVVEANYPEVSITDLPHDDGSFGLVVSDQVFEHVDALPSDAMRETLRVLKPGGWLLHTTCFCTAYHGPGDYWRFTAEGLRSLALRCGAAEAVAETEGHPAEFVVNVLGWRQRPVPAARWHPLNWLARLDRPAYGTMVWVLAQKGGD